MSAVCWVGTSYAATVTRLSFTQTRSQIRGHGSGHNFGLCQAGAIEMSRQGKSMSEILSFYFPGSRIELVKTRGRA